MSNTQTKISKFKIFAATSFTLTLLVGIFPGSAIAAETALNMGTASTYGVLASAAVTSTVNASGISGTAGGDLGVGGGTAPSGTITRTGATILGGSSLAALTAATNALNEARGGPSIDVEMGGKAFTSGAYSGGELKINGTLTLNAQGDSSAVFIFRAASTLITGASSMVSLTNGAQACNVFWQIGSSATFGASSTIVGHVIASTSVSTGASTTVNGQLIAITGAVTLGGTTIVNNSCTAPVVVTPTPTPTSSGTSVFVPVPAPPQDSNITSVTPIICSTTGYKVKVNGFFPTKITNIGVGGVNIAKSAWTQSSSQVVITIPPTSKKSFYVRLFDGRAPVMAFQYFDCVTPVVIVPVVTPSPVATPTPTPTPVVTVIPTPTPTPVVTPTPTPTPVEEVLEPVVETETGGELPATSTPFGNILLVGAALILLSGVGFATRNIRIK